MGRDATFPGIICCHVWTFSSRGALLLATDHGGSLHYVQCDGCGSVSSQVLGFARRMTGTALARVTSHRTFFLCRPGTAFSAPSV